MRCVIPVSKSFTHQVTTNDDVIQKNISLLTTNYRTQYSVGFCFDHLNLYFDKDNK